MKIYRYGCPERPPVPGAVPRDGLINLFSADEPDEKCTNCRWGWVEYRRLLTAEEIEQYELIHMVTYEDLNVYARPM